MAPDCFRNVYSYAVTRICSKRRAYSIDLKCFTSHFCWSLYCGCRRESGPPATYVRKAQTGCCRRAASHSGVVAWGELCKGENMSNSGDLTVAKFCAGSLSASTRVRRPTVLSSSPWRPALARPCSSNRASSMRGESTNNVRAREACRSRSRPCASWSAHGTTPHKRVIYKSGYVTVTVQTSIFLMSLIHSRLGFPTLLINLSIAGYSVPGMRAVWRMTWSRGHRWTVLP